MAAAIIQDDGMEEGSEATPGCAFVVEGGTSSPQQIYFEGTSAFENSTSSLKLEREREGRCADCGLQTHQLQIDPLTGRQVKVPLTVDREVHRGRCLFCFPIFPPEFLSNQHPQAQNLRSLYQSNQCSKSPSMFTTPPMSRRVSQTSFLGFHNPSDPTVQRALSVLQGNTFDIVDILSAMKMVSHDRLVQERGCERLWVLSWEDDNSAAIGRVGGIPIVLNAMARFPMNAHLQQCGCESLQNLALCDYNRREICELGGVVLIVQAMMRHIDCAGIQQCGCTALASIASCEEHHKDIITASGLHAIIIAARHFSEEESVLRAAYDALTALGYDPAERLPRCPTPDQWQ